MKTFNELEAHTNKWDGRLRATNANEVDFSDKKVSNLGSTTMFEGITTKGYKVKIAIRAGDENILDRPCTVKCGCPDFKFQFESLNENHQCLMGMSSMDENNSSDDPGVCKHLIKAATLL